LCNDPLQNCLTLSCDSVSAVSCRRCHLCPFRPDPFQQLLGGLVFRILRNQPPRERPLQDGLPKPLGLLQALLDGLLHLIGDGEAAFDLADDLILFLGWRNRHWSAENFPRSSG